MEQLGFEQVPDTGCDKMEVEVVDDDDDDVVVVVVVVHH